MDLVNDGRGGTADGGGDFRGTDCVKLPEQADIVVTNPTRVLSVITVCYYSG